MLGPGMTIGGVCGSVFGGMVAVHRNRDRSMAKTAILIGAIEALALLGYLVWLSRVGL